MGLLRGSDVIPRKTFPIWETCNRLELFGADDLDEPAPVTLAVELDEEHALPRAELQLALADGHRLAGGAEQHRHAVRVPVALLHVLRADVLGAAVEVVVRVVALARDEPAQQLCEILEKAVL